MVVNACKALGVEKAVAPPDFPIAVGERLWQSGIQVTSDRDTFASRRRVKSEAELAGMRRAQRAAEAGMDAARDLLRRAEPNGAGLVVDGEPLTCERVKRRFPGRSWPTASSPRTSSSRTGRRGPSGTTSAPGRSPRASRS